MTANNFEVGVKGVPPLMGPHPVREDAVHVRRDYVGYGQFEPDSRRQPARAGDEIARLVINLSAPQLVHGATTRPRGMPGKRDFSDGTGLTGRIRAVIRHDYGLGNLVTRPADEGTDPIENSVDTPYRRQPQGPRPDVLDKYVGCRRHLPELTEGQGYPRLPYYHQLSPQACMGDDLYAPFDQRLGGQQ